jgi:molybdenum cofactor cytidylyltransferase
LAAYAAERAASIPFVGKIAVVPEHEPVFHKLLRDLGFNLVVNFEPARGKDNSLRLGFARALEQEATGVLVLLGDMPHVSIAHLKALSVAADHATTAISRSVDILSPPTLMPVRAVRPALERIDQPVRAGLGSMVSVPTTASMLIDYDRFEDFVDGGETPGSLRLHSHP